MPDPKYDKLNLHINDYFFTKTIDQVRPGGIVAIVTSHFTMDNKEQQTAFQANAGTDVTADILFFQKRGRMVDRDES